MDNKSVHFSEKRHTDIKGKVGMYLYLKKVGHKPERMNSLAQKVKKQEDSMEVNDGDSTGGGK